jgi:hypothetical protein
VNSLNDESRPVARDAIPYRPDTMLEVLERHSVLYIVIGGFAAELRGSPYVTRDVEVTPARTRDNLGRLSGALQELEAKLRVPDLEYPLEIPLDDRTFDQGTTWTLVTKFGDLDIALLPDGTQGYEDLKRHATTEQLTDVLAISVASLADVIRSKEAAGREKDRAVLPILRQVLERSREKGRGESGLER